MEFYGVNLHPTPYENTMDGKMKAQKKKALIFRSRLHLIGAAGRNRTHDPLVRSQVLYPAELQPLYEMNYSTRFWNLEEMKEKIEK
jgi:hypothetical protein